MKNWADDEQRPVVHCKCHELVLPLRRRETTMQRGLSAFNVQAGISGPAHHRLGAGAGRHSEIRDGGTSGRGGHLLHTLYVRGQSTHRQGRMSCALPNLRLKNDLLSPPNACQSSVTTN